MTDRGRSPGRHSLPCPARPRLAQPSLALPRPAGPCWPISSALGGQPQGPGARPRFRLPCLASPTRAMPRLAKPRHATRGRAEPCPARPCHVGPSRQPWTANPRGPGPKPRFRFPASPSPAQPCHAWPRLALPCLASPSLAALAYLISPGRPTPGNRSRSPGFDTVPCLAVPGPA